MIKDGAKAWEIKDFLVTQDRCEEVTIEGKNYPGAAAKVSDPPTPIQLLKVVNKSYERLKKNERIKYNWQQLGKWPPPPTQIN